MENRVISKEVTIHYLWGSNCDSWILANNEGLQVKQGRMPPGTKESRHFHSVAQQFFFMLKGTAVFYLDNEKYLMHEQQGLSVPSKAAHYIVNETEDEIEFLVVSQPATDNDRTVME